MVIEICKFFSTMFMQNDVNMCQVNKQFREIDNLRVNNMNLHEELANIGYIFCDKTGTLTQNELIFKSLSLALTDNTITRVFQAPDGDCMKWVFRCTSMQLGNIYFIVSH